MEQTKKPRLFSGRDLWVLILPLLVEQALSVMVGMADTMMVSQAGEAAVSGVSLVDMIDVVIINLFAALGTGGAVVTSQYLGARDDQDARRSADQLALLAGIAGLSVGLLVLVGAGPLLGLLYSGVEPDVMEAGLTYLRIMACAFPFIALYNAGAAVFRSMGNSKVSMKISLLMNLCNIVGNAICIFGFHMGVAGVALPSLFSWALAAGLILKLAANPQNQVPIRLAGGVRLEKRMVRRILSIGIPSALENCLFNLGRILLVSLIALFGTAQIAANAVANNLDNIGCIPGNAFNLAMITVVGRCVGALDFEQARYYVRRLLAADVLVSFLVCGATLLLLLWLTGLYNISQEAKRLACILVLIHNGLAPFLWPFSFTLPNALRAAGDARFTMFVSLGSMAGWRILFSYILGLGMGLGIVGVWIAMILDWLFRILCFIVRYLSGGWQRRYLRQAGERGLL